MSEATLILPNMRGGCATVDGKVHTLFQLSSRSSRKMARPDTTRSSATRDDSAVPATTKCAGD
ncbi:hypothetical protein LPW26_03690 [Rhodopseudomonas sp. HC1]|uniref:hypothetical protein n=1 Tax=Rhodopseudomonas infernalis TaxID=2897386 RepID=UPI001EE8A951|nr:hypothetical protein [Rhodopseudomonas infernalis]MCG6203728.1 hypothetical protein [Rhodopseudomonas infernalis]